MSFVVAALGGVTDAAGSLAVTGSALGEATAAAAARTTSLEAAAADDVSIAVSQLFGAYGEQFQALSAQASAFHDNFVSLLNGGAAAYLNTEVANATGASAAAGDLGSILGPILGPIFGGGGSMPSVPSGGGPTAPTGNPWQTLFTNTGANLQTISSAWTNDPFPVLRQVNANQNRYAQAIGYGLVNSLQNYPTTLANLPTNVQIAARDFSAYPSVLQTFADKQIGYGQLITTSLQNLSADLPKTFPKFSYDLGLAGQAVMTGDLHTAVQYVPRSVLDLFLSGINISNGMQVQIQGPAGDLLPLASLSAQMEQDLIDLLPQGTILTTMAQNAANAVNTATSLIALSIIGPPIATLDGFASGLTAVGAALQTGDALGAVGALADVPAYVLNGALNGVTVVQLTIPLSASFDLTQPPLPPITIGANMPVVIGMPFVGILAPPQPITATVQNPGTGSPVPIAITAPGVQAAGLLTTLLNVIPEQVAAAIAPK